MTGLTDMSRRDFFKTIPAVREFTGDAQDGINILIYWRELMDETLSGYDKKLIASRAVGFHNDLTCIKKSVKRLKDEEDPDVERLEDHMYKAAKYLIKECFSDHLKKVLFDD